MWVGVDGRIEVGDGRGRRVSCMMGLIGAGGSHAWIWCKIVEGLQGSEGLAKGERPFVLAQAGPLRHAVFARVWHSYCCGALRVHCEGETEKLACEKCARNATSHGTRRRGTRAVHAALSQLAIARVSHIRWTRAAATGTAASGVTAALPHPQRRKAEGGLSGVQPKTASRSNTAGRQVCRRKSMVDCSTQQCVTVSDQRPSYDTIEPVTLAAALHTHTACQLEQLLLGRRNVDAHMMRTALKGASMHDHAHRKTSRNDLRSHVRRDDERAHPPRSPPHRNPFAPGR